MARYLRLACEAGRDRRPRLVRLGSADEMLEYDCRDGYMLYEPMFSERKTSNQRNLRRNSLFGPVAQLDRAAVS